MLFKKSNSSPADLTSLRDDVNIAVQNLLEEEEKILGRHIVLRPAVPPSDESAVGWFGGSPKLPETTDWPSIDGEDLIFLAQIDMSKLPETAWCSSGPRDGYLVFFIHPKNIKSRVLHVKGPLVEKTGPSPFHSQYVRDIEDLHPRRKPSFIEDQPFFPRWPVNLESGLPSRPIRTAMLPKKGDDPGHPAPFSRRYNISNKALRPFDGPTLSIQIAALNSAFSGRLVMINKFLREKKLTDNTRDALEAIKAETLETEKEMGKYTAQLAPFLNSFDLEKVDTILDEVEKLPFGLIDYRSDDPFGYAIIDVRPGGGFSNSLNFMWENRNFFRALKKRFRYAYVDDPDSLPDRIRERFEEEFRYDAFYEFGAMSHEPDQDTGLTYDPETQDHEVLLNDSTDVLLELSTSELVGWMFGDMYSLVYMISRNDLKAGNFNNVFTSVTN